MALPSRHAQRTATDSGAWVPLPPSADVLHALGGGHSFESALADIIDNSIDARASRVRIRFVVEDARLIAVQLRDDGTGMSQESLIKALRLGQRRDYTEGDLGHFGIGLKAASMRQANRLTVYTAINDDDGLSVSAVSLDPSDSPDGTLGISVLERRLAEFGYEYGYESDPAESGTLVEWTRLRGVSDAANADTRQEWLDQRLEATRGFLGLVFHRIIDAGDLRIEIDVFDASSLFAGVPRRVEPVNPFGYQQSGRSGYPRVFMARLPDGNEFSATCHVLPPKGIDRGLPRKREEWQGIYVYRNHRLLTVEPDWQGLAIAKSELRLARVSIELDDELLPHAMPNPEKNGVEFDPVFAAALQASVGIETSTTFNEYLDHARIAWKESKKRTTDKPLTEITEGLPSLVRQQIGESFGWRTGHAPVSIVWEELSEDDIFQVDLTRRMLVLNSAHAERLGGEDSPQANAISALLYLLVEPNFTRSSYLRASTHDHLEQIDSLLLAALYSVADETAPQLRTIPAEALARLRYAMNTSAVDAAPNHRTPLLQGSSAELNSQEDSPSRIQAADLENNPHATQYGSEVTELALDDPRDTEAALLEQLVAPSIFSGREETLGTAASGISIRQPRSFGPSDALDTESLAVFDAYCEGAGIGVVPRRVV